MNVQRFVVEVGDSKNVFVNYLRLATETVLESVEEIAVQVVDHDSSDLNLLLPPALDGSFPVILISGWFTPKNDEKKSYFNGYGEWVTFPSSSEVASTVEEVIEYIMFLLEKRQKSWARKFTRLHGDGYDDTFNKFDGGVKIGFRIRNCDCFPEWLAIEMTHIYHGK